MIRIGHGFDVHKFGGQGPIFIAGVEITYEQGLIAHSDGDVAIHALCDAMLGALALGDIGRHFPDTDAQYAGVDSKILLKTVFELAKDRGYKMGNLDLTIVAQAPKMSPYIDQMSQTLASILETSTDNVNVKATTTEKLGYTGRKEGIATHAVVLLLKE
ncbi:MAG TPA: 2-C-methyl-D-erythritol 2,4-cyclodiphosphate synthase [Psychromonas hadalis]|nr:2-C-methyl-D-erythritol 2,4-cyclodiphosphate synthase [Psychromonas hadalis]